MTREIRRYPYGRVSVPLHTPARRGRVPCAFPTFIFGRTVQPTLIATIVVTVWCVLLLHDSYAVMYRRHSYARYVLSAEQLPPTVLAASYGTLRTAGPASLPSFLAPVAHVSHRRHCAASFLRAVIAADAHHYSSWVGEATALAQVWNVHGQPAAHGTIFDRVRAAPTTAFHISYCRAVSHQLR
jgi:hypothetical protein